jgi:hypothetical protein
VNDIVIDIALLLGFAVPHSLLLRPRGDALVERFVPRQLFYTAYGLISSVSLLLVYALWRPISGMVWSLEGAPAKALLAVHAAGWGLMGFSLWHYGPLRQPGLEQWWAYVRGRSFRARPFPTTGPYRFTRYPIYVAMFIMIWATPWMTAGHLLVAGVWSAYLAAGVLHKEVRLRRSLGEAWVRYARAVPALPRLWRGRTVEELEVPAA